MSYGSQSNSPQRSLDKRKTLSTRARSPSGRSGRFQSAGPSNAASQAPSTTDASARTRPASPKLADSRSPAQTSSQSALAEATCRTKTSLAAPMKAQELVSLQAPLPSQAPRRQSSRSTPTGHSRQQQKSTHTPLVISAGLSQEQRYRFQQSAAEAWRRERAQEFAQTLALRKSEKKAKKKAKRKAAREAKRLREQVKTQQIEQTEASGAEGKPKPKPKPKRKLKHCAIL